MMKLFINEVLLHVDKATIILSGTKESCVVAIICDPKEKGIKVKPITIKGTLAEVEDALEKAVKEIFTDNKEVLTNYKDVAKEVKTSATKTTAKADSKAKVGTEEDEEKEAEKVPVKEFSYTKEQKALLKKGTEAVEKAGQASDPDMVDYFEKEYMKKYTAAGLPQSDIDALAASFTKIRGGDAGNAETEEPDNDDGLFAEAKQNIKEVKKETKVEEKAKKKEESVPVAEKKVEEKAKKKEEPVPAAAEKEDDNMIF